MYNFVLFVQYSSEVTEVILIAGRQMKFEGSVLEQRI